MRFIISELVLAALVVRWMSWPAYWITIGVVAFALLFLCLVELTRELREEEVVNRNAGWP